MVLSRKRLSKTRSKKIAVRWVKAYDVEQSDPVELTSPTIVRGSHPFHVGLIEEVQRRENPRRRKKPTKKGPIHITCFSIKKKIF